MRLKVETIWKMYRIQESAHHAAVYSSFWRDLRDGRFHAWVISSKHDCLFLEHVFHLFRGDCSVI